MNWKTKRIVEEIKKYIKDSLTEIECEGDNYIYGTLYNRHRVKCLFGDDYIKYQFGKNSTFDKWSNSTDLETEVPYYLTLDYIKDEWDRGVEMTDVIFKKIPKKYWNKFLQVRY